MRGFEFQRLRVFDASASAATVIDQLSRKIPLYHRALRDQLMRAVISIVLNIAEGADEFSVREKARFYRMARRSAAEAAAALELLTRFGVFDRTETTRALELLNQTAAMLSNMMTRMESSEFRMTRERTQAGEEAQHPDVDGGPGPGAGAGPRLPDPESDPRAERTR